MRCDDGYRLFSSRTREVERARSPRRSAAAGRARRRAPCRSTFAVASSSVRSATSARICSSARAVSASICLLRLLEPPLAVGLGLLARRARCIDSACLPGLRRGSPRPASAPAPISLRCSSSSAARPRARAVGLLDRLADPLAALVDRLLDRTERVALEHEERDPGSRRSSRSSAPA